MYFNIAPLGHKEVLSDGPMVWSRNVPGEAAWNDCVQPDNKSLEEGKWYNVTVVADGNKITFSIQNYFDCFFFITTTAPAAATRITTTTIPTTSP